MPRPTITGISPLFIVADLPASLAFYRDRLGFEITFRGPAPDDEFFGIVRRDGATILLKALGEIVDGQEVAVEPVPNYGRQPAFSWDAFLDVPDPDALAAEFAARGVPFAEPLADSDDGLRGFGIKDLDGYGLFFGCLGVHRQGATPVGLAAAAIQSRLGNDMPEPYLGPDGDYLRLVRQSPRPVDVSISCCGMPAGRYSVQVCLDGDPLAIAVDDECDLPGLVDVCAKYLAE
jgi:catechol 2,3-dioxygenase-like lactoylglutathione lyase family enzyme